MFRPGGEIRQQKIHLFLLCDCSGSMKGEPIKHVNHAIDNLFMQLKAQTPSHIDLQVAIIQFSDAATWHLLPTSIGHENLWQPITLTRGVTQLGDAYQLLKTWYQQHPQPSAATSSENTIISLITDGMPTDEAEKSLLVLLETIKNYHNERIALGIGNDAHRATLEQFASSENNLHIAKQHEDIEPLITQSILKAISTFIH